MIKIKTKFSTSVISIFAFLAISMFNIGCKDDTKNVNNDNPIEIPIQTSSQVVVNLGVAGDYVILAGSQVSNIPTSAITGNIGISPASGSFVTGFSLIHVSGAPQATAAQLTGVIHASDFGAPTPTTLTSAKGDLTTAYNNAAGRTSTDIVLLAGNIGGLTLTPGLYKSTGSLEISSENLTFDAKGNANAVFIIQIASSFSVTSGRQVILAGGAKASNIFWQVGTSATFGTTSVMKGIVMADQSISMQTGARIDGRLLARIAAVTLAGNIVTAPAN
jgi:hypothetical protein